VPAAAVVVVVALAVEVVIAKIRVVAVEDEEGPAQMKKPLTLLEPLPPRRS
jgi:hypothetical protein